MEPDQGTGGGGGCGGRRPARCGALGAPTTHASAPDRWEEQGREAAKQTGRQPHQVQPSVSSFHLFGGGGGGSGGRDSDSDKGPLCGVQAMHAC